MAASGDDGVSIHVNEVPLIVPRLYETEYFDVQAVEVLRGPQGTLYGRNATGGVVNMTTARASTQGTLHEHSTQKKDVDRCVRERERECVCVCACARGFECASRCGYVCAVGLCCVPCGACIAARVVPQGAAL